MRLSIFFCPGKPAVNYLFFGDSFNALVKDGTKTDVGTIIKENKRTLFGHKHEVWSEMTWGKGLSESLDAAERAMIKLAERPEPRPYVIVISWSGNDVVGRNGYIDNPAALAGWATDSEAKRKAAMDIIERNARAVMTVRDRLRHIAYRDDVVQIVLIVPRDYETYGLSESYKVQMDGHARLLHGSAGITVLDPQTLISNTSRADRIHTDDNERNRKHYISYFVAAAKLGYSIGQINRFEGAMNWYRLEREYLDIDTSIPIVGTSPQETGGPAIAKNPEDPFDNEVRERELEAINEIAAQEPKREIFLEAEKEANPLYPLDTVKAEAKILYMMQPDIHAATVSGLNDVIDWSSSSDEEDQVIRPPGSQPKVSRPKGQAVEVAAVDPNDVGEDGQIKLILTSKRQSHNKMTAAISAATPKVKAKAMPKQAASSSDQASVAGSSKTQEIRGPEIIPKAKAAPKAAANPGTRGQAAEPKREWIKCSGIKTPQNENYGRRTFLSKKVSYLVRGHAHEHATRSIPEINLRDNSFDYAAVAKWIQRRYDWNCSQYILFFRPRAHQTGSRSMSSTRRPGSNGTGSVSCRYGSARSPGTTIG